MSNARSGQSIEQQVTTAVVVAALLAAITAAIVMARMHAQRAQSDSQANAVVDAVTDAVAKGNPPQPILDAFIAAGVLRAGVVYGANGTRLASAGTSSAEGEQVCRSLANGGSVCVEQRASAGASMRDVLTGGAIAAAAGVIAAIALAAFLINAIRKRLRAMRMTIEETIRTQTYASRLRPETGELAPFVRAINQLLEQMQNRDVTLRRRTTELESANKDLEAFASAVSHDLRGPLGSIAGFSQALDEDYGKHLDETGRECIYWIRQGARQMQQLMEGLLQMARLSRVEMQRTEVDLTSMARRIAGALQKANPDRSVEFRIADGVIANGDEPLLSAVIENLMNNAFKFTSKRPNARIEVGVLDDNGTPAYYVRDNGAGFDPQHAAKMFRPFQRLHSESEFKGTGIGLATVQKIVQRHGGRAWAEGEPERGATVYFTTGSAQAIV